MATNKDSLLDIGIPQGRDVSRVDLGLSPWIHGGRGAGKGGILAGMSCLPRGPDAIYFRVVHPKHRIGRRGRDASHGPAYPNVPRVMYPLERWRECVEGAISHRRPTAAAFGSKENAPMFRVTV